MTTMAELMKHVGKESATDPWPNAAWPGGYTIAYLADDGELICSDCMDTQSEIHFDGQADGWRIDGAVAFGADTDYPEDDVHCAHCNKVIEEAYS